MRSGELPLAALLLSAVVGCGSGSPAPAAAGAATTTLDANVLPITVNGALCSSDSYANKPCVQVTICVPGTSSCQTVDDILLDTGSYGVRVFKQAIAGLSLPRVSLASGPLAECAQFGDGSSEWGPVEMASVILGGEPAVEVPIQIIDSTFGTVPGTCAGAQQDPSSAGLNGILGIGMFAQDCGSACANSSGNGLYYTCSGSSCSGAAVPLSYQVQNPVALLPDDNNGVVVQLPRIPQGGAPSVDGYLVLGIGTRANNVPSGATRYSVNRYGDLSTTLGGVSYLSFIDTGSNGLFFSPPSSSQLPNCASPASAWFCPSSMTSFSATNSGFLASGGAAVSFQIGSFLGFATSSNRASAEIGGNATSSGGFDWGLPFFFGRSVYVGLEGTGSSLGAGPYVAY